MARFVDFGKATIGEAIRCNITGEAAKVAYYIFLSFFPLILVLFALTGLVGGDAAFDWIMGQLTGALPPDAVRALAPVVGQITGQRRPGVLSIGIVLALWSTTGIFAALADGLNTMYRVKESRSWWRKRLVVVGITLASLVLGVGGTVALLAGGTLGTTLGLGLAWEIVRIPLALLLLSGLLWLIYYFLPDHAAGHSKSSALIGAVVGSLLWIGGTLVFRLYIEYFGASMRSYGLVGGIIVFLLWLDLAGIVILFGGVVAAVRYRRRRGEAAQPGGLPLRRVA